eukprot:2646966-Pyramimonas_sp.AAC.1
MSAPKTLGEWQHPSVEAALNAQARTQSALSRWGTAMLLLAVAAGLVFFKGDGWVPDCMHVYYFNYFCLGYAACQLLCPQRVTVLTTGRGTDWSSLLQDSVDMAPIYDI